MRAPLRRLLPQQLEEQLGGLEREIVLWHR